MNDELENLQRVMEEATAVESGPADRMDPETASLREAWISFGQLLESAQPAFDESTLPLGEFPIVSPLRAPTEGWSREGQGVRVSRRMAPRRRWLLPAAGLLAASLLICVAAVWSLRNANEQEVVAPAAQIARSELPAASPVGEQPQVRSATEAAQWDDALDEQFAQLSQQAVSVHEDQFAQTDAFALIEYNVEQLQQEMQTDNHF